jgi:hypothetical protein
MGRLLLNNCVKNDDGTYTVATDSEGNKLLIDLSYKIEQDYQNLPLGKNTLKRFIYDDTWKGTVKNIGFLNDKKIGFGAYYCLITYTDGTTSADEGIGGVDFFKNTTKGDTKTIVNSKNLDLSKTVKSIEFKLIYELRDETTTGKWYSIRTYEEFTNWVNSYTINFK